MIFELVEHLKEKYNMCFVCTENLIGFFSLDGVGYINCGNIELVFPIDQIKVDLSDPDSLAKIYKFIERKIHETL